MCFHKMFGSSMARNFLFFWERVGEGTSTCSFSISYWPYLGISLSVKNFQAMGPKLLNISISSCGMKYLVSFGGCFFSRLICYCGVRFLSIFAFCGTPLFLYIFYKSNRFFLSKNMLSSGVNKFSLKVKKSFLWSS